MQYENITTDRQLGEYCQKLNQCDSIAFDTEFIAENSYRPLLCLVQVAAGGDLAVIDPLGIDDLSPFWEAVTRPGCETIVHAARGEMEFCLHAVDRMPEQLVDVQLAAGLVGVEYPAGYSTLISKLLGRSSRKHETRTDWRRRPLSKRQIDYALDDVRYLHPIRDVIWERLDQLDRHDWLGEEMDGWKAELRRAMSKDRWRRVSGIANLDARGLAVVRELWHWRETEAERRNQPVRRVLRDDLIVELARRQTSNVKRIQAVRGLERGDLRRRLGEIAEHIQRALDLSDDDLPHRSRREPTGQLSVLGQFLFAALGSICRQSKLAPALVGTPGDIRHLIAYRTGPQSEHRRTPKLAQGWRAEFVGRLFDDLMAGKKAIRITDPTSDSPLAIESIDADC